MAIITLAQAKAQLGIDPDDTSDDDELQLYLEAATIAVEKARGQVIDVRPVIDDLDLTGAATFVLRSSPAIELTSVEAVDGSQTWDITALHLYGQSGRVSVLSGPPVTGLVSVSYTAGMQPIPDNYVLAALIIVQHLWETQRGSMGVQLGGEAEAYTPGRGFAIPRRAIELLGLSLPGVA
ncbi:phage head-tail connector protein [Streptomyces sp. NPDC051320]|uniref:phage head-tail connector protein n=1 Tax=Streptomyces sp. NPDC051320 TaxID=3154644 RepID=UPI0034383FC2